MIIFKNYEFEIKNQNPATYFEEYKNTLYENEERLLDVPHYKII